MREQGMFDPARLVFIDNFRPAVVCHKRLRAIEQQDSESQAGCNFV
jgi:hypothetical protein